MSNYKSAIKSTSSTTKTTRFTSMSKSTETPTPQRRQQQQQQQQRYQRSITQASTKFILINLLILPQCLVLCAATTTRQQQQPLEHKYQQTLASNAAAAAAADDGDSLSVLAVIGLPTISSQATSANVTHNAARENGSGNVTTPAVETEDPSTPTAVTAPAVNDLNMDINQLITHLTNATLFNDALSQEYDTTTVSLLGNVTHSCLQTCIEEETKFQNDFGVKCSMGDNRTECYRRRCFNGCELWWNALKEFEPCQEACSSLQFYPYDLPCISACEQSQRLYWHLQRLRVERVVTTLQPQLLHDNEVVNTLTLKWPIALEQLPAQYLASRPFNIQYRYELRPSVTATATATAKGTSMAGETFLKIDDDHANNATKLQQKEDYTQQETDIAEQWWNLADYNCNENFECDIMDGLVPYTSYRFRFELPFGQNLDDVLYTPASEVYTTPAMGAPISPPLIIQALALDKDHVAIFWEKGKFTNGPVTNYKILIAESFEGNSGTEHKELLPSNASYYIFPNAHHHQYTIRLSMLNQDGEGPYAETMVRKINAINDPALKLDVNSLLVAGEYSLILKSLDPLIETKTLFKSEEILMDFDVLQHSRQVFVVNAKGHIFSFYVDNALNYTQIHLKPEIEGFVVRKLSVDWLNQMIYMAGEISSNTWQIVSTDLQGSGLQFIATNLTKSLKQLQVDPVNGWLFASDEEGHITKIDLFSKKSANLARSLENGLFYVDYQSYLLKSYDLKEKILQELSFDGQYHKKLGRAMTGKLQGDLMNFHYVGNNVLWASNATHFLKQDFSHKEEELIFISELEVCGKMLPFLTSQQARLVQPLPRPMEEPQLKETILSDTKAIIMWSAPAQVQQFQSQACWRNWEYELEIMDVSSNSAFNIRSIRSTFFVVERLQANNLYKIKVRALFSGANGRMMGQAEPSPWSEELHTRTWPMAKHRLLWASQAGLYESDELAEEVEIRGLAAENIQSFVQVNSSLFYVNYPERSLKCYNLLHNHLPCGFEAENVLSLDYDWRGGKMYWSDVKRNCLVRSDLKGGHRELLPLFEARYLKVDSSKGFIYYTTDTKLVRRYLNGFMPSQEVEYYHVNGNGESIRGFVIVAQYLYWLVQHQEEYTKLFRCPLDYQMEEVEEVLQLPNDMRVRLNSLQYVKEIEGFMFLNEKDNSAIFLRQEKLNRISRIQLPFKHRLNQVRLLSNVVAPFRDESIVPEPLDREAIEITEGYWDDFNIKWVGPNNAQNLSIFYKVLITPMARNSSTSQEVLTFEVSQPLVRITEFRMASHMIDVTITPETLWAKGPATSVLLKTPSAAPKQPKNLRVYVEHLQEPLQDEANVTALVRWDSPDNISQEKEAFYKVFCWLKDELHSVKDIEDMGLKSHEVKFYNLMREESYMFQVQAFSLSRSKGGEKTALLTHFINPEMQASPKLIYSTSELIGELDLDLNVSKTWIYTSSEVEHMALMSGEQRLLWVNENVELMTYQPGSASLKLARMRAEVLSLAVDWIQRKVYWAELSGDAERAVDIYELPLNSYEGKVMMGSLLFSLSKGKLLKDMVVLPFSHTLLWLEHESGEENCTLQARNLTDLLEIKLKNLPPLPLLNMFEGSWHSDMETINLVDYKGKLYAYEVQRHLLTNLKIPTSSGDHIRNYERDSGYIYSLGNRTIKAYNRRKHNLEFSLNMPEVRVIKAFNFQPYPKRECLLPADSEVVAEKHQSMEYEEQNLFPHQVGESYMELTLPLVNSKGNCRLPIPGLRYEISLSNNLDYDESFKVEENMGKLNITNLKPYTNYSVNIEASSYYQQRLAHTHINYPEFYVSTLEGTPWKPSNFSLQALSPTEVLVSWQEPEQLNAAQVLYVLNFKKFGENSATSQLTLEGFEKILENLEPDSKYTMSLMVLSGERKNETEPLHVYTYPQPWPLQLLDKQAYNMTLLWHPNTVYSSAILECLPHSQEPEITPFSIDISGIDGNITLVNLQPKTRYEFYLKLKFPTTARTYVWPTQQSNNFIYETLGDVPGRPGKPCIEHITGEIFKISWLAAAAHGALSIDYSLEALQARNPKRIRREAVIANSNGYAPNVHTMISQLPWVEELQPIEDKWIVYCNTSETSCIIRDLHTLHLLMFRVRAHSEAYGWGPYSEDSDRVLEPYVSPQKRNSLVLAIIAPALIVGTCVIILFIIRKVHKRRMKAKKLLAKSRPSIWSNVSSMQQQMTARNRGFSMTSNCTMYTGGPLSDADIALLPHIQWSQISLLNFLGSGAFGEVYEGLMKHEDDEVPEKVAIKTLRKGASEFAELLQEAQLMSNFKHDNIVRLIGVCCDTESISIIMEHMEGGDLLSYLRESRPSSQKPVASLQLLDLMSMCIDVATGMAYLEDMHFVHRDLACRNCLVSSRIPSKRTVKIGDFGLARDIYKNDYYRKEGEALVPVRWMAPESLVDGVFTTQSDVWAFGVLCWEILTLGQQPYAARNNFEVLSYVKDGGRLEQPDNCPDKFFALMSECWRNDAEARPTFRKIFNSLLSIKTDVRRVSLGYNIDDSDYAMYANQHGILFSTFLGTPLNKVNEEEDEQDVDDDDDDDGQNAITYETQQNLKNEEEIKLNTNKAGDKFELANEKIDMKVRFENNLTKTTTAKTDDGGEAHMTDETHLIDAKLYRMQENPDYYVNEGISRL
uniref:Tyrosine-protein kinase receptor n=1 Tax=Stomoxys calcitrans TaxID=35570 RepID=A0A1I8P476_STOCA